MQHGSLPGTEGNLSFWTKPFSTDQQRDLELRKFQIQICVLPRQGRCRADVDSMLHRGFQDDGGL